MTFVYPLFLWALGILSIPVIIHLFNFRKTTRIYFSNTRFLKQVKEASTAKRKLKHYLILASRLLFLLFLVLAFAQPIIPAQEQISSNRNIVLYLDNSQSMSAQTSDKTRGLDAGINFINAVANVFPPDTRYKLITNDFAPYSNAFKTKAEVQELLSQVRLSPVSRTMQEVQDRIYQNVSARSQEVFWISDFQKSTLGNVSAPTDSSYRWHLVPIPYDALSNVFVDSAYLDNPFAAGGEKNVLRVRVRNDGKKNVDQLNLKLTINNVQAATTVASVPSGGVQETAFDLTTGLRGLNEAQISFNDFPVSFDNQFYVALNFTDKIHVLEIKASNAITPIEKVFGNHIVFDYKGFDIRNFNYSLLSNADLVIINGLNTVDASLAAAIRTYMNDYGSVMFIPGTNPDVNNLKSFLQLPQLASSPVKEQVELDRPDFSNPFFENVFEEKSVSLAMPKAARILQWGNDRASILQFKNGQPFLSTFQQTGKLFLLATTLDNTSTNFFNHAIFVPVMYRIASTSKKHESKLYYTLRENFLSLRVDSLKSEQQLKLTGEEEIIPPQRQVGNHVLIDIPKFSISQGFYRVVSGKDTVNLLAFNLDKAESLMDQYTGNDVKTMLGSAASISIFDAGSANTFSNEIKERYLGTPLWKYAVLLSLIFLFVEILLIRFLK